VSAHHDKCLGTVATCSDRERTVALTCQVVRFPSASGPYICLRYVAGNPIPLPLPVWPLCRSELIVMSDDQSLLIISMVIEAFSCGNVVAFIAFPST
jgi:hypothetical protein